MIHINSSKTNLNESLIYESNGIDSTSDISFDQALLLCKLQSSKNNLKKKSRKG